MNGEIQEPGADFKSVDFLPELLEPSGLFRSGTYEDFKTVIGRANEFLRRNQKWRIVNCESVEFKSRDDCVDPNKMSYTSAFTVITKTSYVRGLRLWLTERQEGTERKQQIGYFNLIPQQLRRKGLFDMEFESLDTVVARFNSNLEYEPLPGRIINVESQRMKVTNFRNFDPDRSNWSERPDDRKIFVIVIRIFYDLTEKISEKIGVKDFIPDRIGKRGICTKRKYERFSDVVTKASAWCAEQSDMRICNAQTLEIKEKKPKELNPQKMKFSEHGAVPTFYVRILRVIYTQPLTSAYSNSEKPSTFRGITYRTFIPEKKSTDWFSDDYENFVLTMKRMSAWLQITGARVLSAETLAYRRKLDFDSKEGLENNYTLSSEINNTEHWIYVIRVYLDGAYEEPPIEMLPPPPELEKDCCLVS